MPRASNGTYTLPQSAFVPGTVISSSAVNSDFSDIASALTDSLSRSGDGGMTAPLEAADGTEALPGYTFGTDPNTGIYRVGADSVAVVTGGVAALTVDSSQNVTLAANLTVTGTSNIGAVAGTGLTLTSTDAGASAAPLAILDRNSASPAASDVLGAVQFKGRDNGGGTDIYGQIHATILDTTAASEDGSIVIQAAVAGALTTVGTFAPGLVLGAATGGSQGNGTVNATGFYLNGVALSTGKIGQVVTASVLTTGTVNAAIPNDDSIPLNSEGTEVITLAITPANASSVLLIEAEVPVAGDGSGGAVGSLFVDSTANALYTTMSQVANNFGSPLVISWYLTAGSTSARTYKVRIGTMGGSPTNIYYNGTSAGRKFGGVMAITMKITEILP